MTNLYFETNVALPFFIIAEATLLLGPVQHLPSLPVSDSVSATDNFYTFTFYESKQAIRIEETNGFVLRLEMTT